MPAQPESGIPSPLAARHDRVAEFLIHYSMDRISRIGEKLGFYVAESRQTSLVYPSVPEAVGVEPLSVEAGTTAGLSCPCDARPMVTVEIACLNMSCS